MNWHFEQEVDLQRLEEEGAKNWPDLLMVEGDSLAHEWRIHVFTGGQPMDLTGYTITGYFDRSDGKMVPVVGTANGSLATVVLPQSVYAAAGPLMGLLRAGKDGQIITLAAGRWNVRRGPGNEIVDPGHVVPSLGELLAKIGEMEEATNTASKAAQTANTAAENADSKAALAQQQATAAQTAADNASAQATAATTAAGNASTAAEAAAKATGKANTAADNASAAATAAQTAADSANAAKAGADAAALRADTAAQAANSAAADLDAKVTNAVAPLNEHVEAIQAQLNDTFNPGPPVPEIINGYAFNGFGKFTAMEGAFIAVYPIPTNCPFVVIAKLNVEVPYGSSTRISVPQYLDADKNRIGEAVVKRGERFGVITLAPVHIPENAKYIGIPYLNGTELRFEMFSPNYLMDNRAYIPADKTELGEASLIPGDNLIEAYAGCFYLESGKYFGCTDGGFMTQPIRYEEGKTLYHNGAANTVSLYFFTEDYTFISSARIDSGRAIPHVDGAAYYLINYGQLEAYPIDSPWAAYSNIEGKKNKPSRIINPRLIDISISRSEMANRYKGMAASFMGDSLTDGGSGGDYFHYLNQYFGFSSVTGCGVGGTCVSGSADNAMWQTARVNSLDLGSDIVFIMGGTNDAPSGPSGIGEISPGNHDTSTFVGAYNVLLSKIFYKFGALSQGLYSDIDYSGITQAEHPRDICVILITPPQRFPNRGSTDDPWAYAANTNAYADTVLAIGRMHGLPVADIRACSSVNIFNRDRYISGPEMPNRNGDGTHLSPDAHRKWAEVIIGKMLEIADEV